MKSRNIGLALSFLTLLSPAAADASLFFSTKAMGMAGAVMAYPLDSMTIAYNPAAAAFIESRWDFGVNYHKDIGSADFDGNAFTNSNYDTHASGDDWFLPEFGVSQWMCDGLMTWGFVIYNRSYYKTAFD